MPVFPGYSSRSRSLEQMQESARRNFTGSRSLEEQQESARRNLNDGRLLEEMQEHARRIRGSLEEMQARMQRCNDQYSREKRQAGWAKRRAPK
jgi:hypothetical protein